MPPFISPARSGVHRRACLSLYHALISACSRLPTPDPKFDGLQKLVQTQFRQKRDIESPTQISKSLKAGYEALDLLQSCSRANSESIDQLDTLRREALALSEKIQSERRALAAIYPKQDPNSRQVKARARHQRYCSATRPHADVEPILSRPRPKVSGRRRVPVLVNARGVPFLRIKKPQPRSLSRAIGSKLDNRWNRILRRERLEAELAMARDEDRWDEYVGETVTQSWTVPVLVSLKEVRNQIRASDDENARLAKEMWEVVLKERELAEKEKWERKHERRQRQLARREARRAAAVENSGHINGAEDGDQQDPKPAT